MPTARRQLVRAGVRTSLVVAGLALLANTAWLVFTANLTVGMALTATLGLGCLAWGIWLPDGRLRWINLVAATGLAAIVAFAGVLAYVGNHDDATGDEDAVIVLGAAVHGRRISNTLASRLDAALAYHQRNPKALIVVSGGQGPQEDIAEGAAMQAYLTANGVRPEQIIVEDQAASTSENFAFSKALLDQRLPPGYRVVLVTDEFHVFRAGRVAAATGLEATHVSSSTPWYFWPANYLREELVTAVFWLTPS